MRYCLCSLFFFFKQKTAYELRISDWSSDVCSSDLRLDDILALDGVRHRLADTGVVERLLGAIEHQVHKRPVGGVELQRRVRRDRLHRLPGHVLDQVDVARLQRRHPQVLVLVGDRDRKSNTSELQSLMRISYAVFCLKKKKKNTI